jgi:hypothetical protein
MDSMRDISIHRSDPSFAAAAYQLQRDYRAAGEHFLGSEKDIMVLGKTKPKGEHKEKWVFALAHDI